MQIIHITLHVWFKINTWRTISIKQKCCMLFILALSLPFILCWNFKSILSRNSFLGSTRPTVFTVGFPPLCIKSLITLVDNFSKISAPEYYAFIVLCFENRYWILHCWYSAVFDASSLAYKTVVRVSTDIYRYNYSSLGAWGRYLKPRSHWDFERLSPPTLLHPVSVTSDKTMCMSSEHTG